MQVGILLRFNLLETGLGSGVMAAVAFVESSLPREYFCARQAVDARPRFLWGDGGLVVVLRRGGFVPAPLPQPPVLAAVTMPGGIKLRRPPQVGSGHPVPLQRGGHQQCWRRRRRCARLQGGRGARRPRARRVGFRRFLVVRVGAAGVVVLGLLAVSSSSRRRPNVRRCARIIGLPTVVVDVHALVPCRRPLGSQAQGSQPTNSMACT